jgi:hypothetical protein
MRTRITKLLAGLTAVTALAVGGAAISSAAGKTPPVNPPAAVNPPAVNPPAATDGDTLQQGDQTSPDTAADAAETSSEAPSSESGSEVVGNDGPGGHADEPGNPNADNQFEGVQ